jgi:hypothetical protein
MAVVGAYISAICRESSAANLVYLLTIGDFTLTSSLTAQISGDCPPLQGIDGSGLLDTESLSDWKEVSVVGTVAHVGDRSGLIAHGGRSSVKTAGHRP